MHSNEATHRGGVQAGEAAPTAETHMQKVHYTNQAAAPPTAGASR